MDVERHSYGGIIFVTIARRSQHLLVLIGAVVVAVSGCSSHGDTSSIPSSPSTPASVPESIFPATWQLDPAFDRPSPSDTEVHVVVTERQCANGQRPGDRLQPPEVALSTDAVVVTFLVESLLVTESTVTCPDNPAVPYDVQLGEPLGERDLFDGGESSPSSRLIRMPLPTHGLYHRDLQDQEDPPVTYTGTLIGTLDFDPTSGCARLLTPAGVRTVWWPVDTEAHFLESPRLLFRGAEVATEGDTIVVVGGRAPDGTVPNRCAASEFVWIGVEVLTPTPPLPPAADPDVVAACYDPFVMEYAGYTVTMDRAIWCTLDAGNITVVTPEGLIVEGPMAWIVGADFGDLLLINPHTGEPIVTIPDEVYRAAVAEHHELVINSG